MGTCVRCNRTCLVHIGVALADGGEAVMTSCTHCESRVWHRNGEERGIGGMMDIRGRVPDEIPANWLVYFAVDDTDATVAKARELGGAVAVEPMDIPDVGRFAVLTDPHGSAFAVIQNTIAG